ncbi:BCCT family transporter [Bacillus massiliigorillae]|uniref:BCCT family transporter n=1 Tax=Bacillus massiliigorillae TaxID=1243664 RepID=UPI0003A286F0|nr:BCCT family transporter [Bacillus massiliigorillae]
MTSERYSNFIKEGDAVLPRRIATFGSMLILLITIVSIIFPQEFVCFIGNIQTYLLDQFKSLILLIPLLFLIFLIVIAVSKNGKRRLGEGKPEFSLLSWVGMMFTAGIGIGTVFFGVAEPYFHAMLSPVNLSNSSESEVFAKAMEFTIFDWGLPVWSIYTLSGLMIGYFAYHPKNKGKFLPGIPIQSLFKNKRLGQGLATTTNLLAAVTSVFSVSASVAIGSSQLTEGVNYVFPSLNISQLQGSFIFLILLIILYSVVAILPLEKGMNIMSNVTIILALGIMLYIALLMSKTLLGDSLSSMFGSVIGSFKNHFSFTFSESDSEWLIGYPLTYILWWISWTPFVGIFFAKISKGRSFREYITVSIIIPTLFSMLWFSVFGSHAFANSGVAESINNNIYSTFFVVLNQFPFAKFLSVITVIMLVLFVCTTATSASICIATITNNGEKPKPGSTLIWALSMGGIALALVLSGSFDGLKQVATLLGFPYLLVIFLQIVSFVKSLTNKKDNEELNKVESYQEEEIWNYDKVQ